MITHHFIFTFIFSLLFFSINAENEIIEKEKILSMKIESCKENKDCTGSNSICENGKCLYTVFCHDNSCIFPDENTIKFVPLKSNTTLAEETVNGTILEACTVESNNQGNCYTRLCNTNSDCFSNQCINHTCIIDENLPLMECSNRYEGKVMCGKAAFEKCTKDDECFYGRCNEDNTCHDLYFSPKFDKMFGGFLMVIQLIILVIIIIIVLFIVLLFRRCRKHKV